MILVDTTYGFGLFTILMKFGNHEAAIGVIENLSGLMYVDGRTPQDCDGTSKVPQCP
jgi:hypothetical protein